MTAGYDALLQAYARPARQGVRKPYPIGTRVRHVREANEMLGLSAVDRIGRVTTKAHALNGLATVIFDDAEGQYHNVVERDLRAI
jgi:hypothetical protein